ncbi:MAG: tol-pal system protein YbgF [Gammaproteobacteria bacterium]|nr:tol-pal system protein YbgF [Gammaproteobacteria bacterium]
MRSSLLIVSLVCGALSAVQPVQARDIQLRSGSDDASSVSAPNTAPEMNTRKLTTEERLDRLERILNSQGLGDMLMRMDTLQSEIQKLRGDLELQSHQLDEIKQRQRDLYVDIDRRLLRLERNEPGNSGTTGVTPQPATPIPTGNAAATQTVQPVPAAGASDTAAPVDDAGEQQAYQKAFDTLRDLKYDQAVTAFNGFLAKYPKGRYAHIAQYWIGEADYAQRKFKQAINDYQKLIDNYPTSPKVAEAMLKIGYSQYELKNNKAAETILNQLIKSYPGTTEAGQAQNLLQKIRLNR